MRKHGDLAANRFGTTPVPGAAATDDRRRRLATIIEALTALDPARRPASAGAALAALRA
jgi:hypothetical protein